MVAATFLVQADLSGTPFGGRYADDFNRTPGAFTAGNNTLTSGGATWTDTSPALSSFGIDANYRANSITTAGGGGSAALSVGASKGTLQADMYGVFSGGVSNGNSSFSVRSNDTTTGFLVVFDGQTLTLTLLRPAGSGGNTSLYTGTMTPGATVSLVYDCSVAGAFSVTLTAGGVQVYTGSGYGSGALTASVIGIGGNGANSGVDNFSIPTSPTWTDITTYVLTTGAGQPISITGPARQDEQADTTPSTCSFTLINDDGRFTPGRAASPYYPHILPGVRVRVSETVSGTTYNRFDGYVDSWERTVTGPSSLVTVSATDILARMGTFQPLQSLYVEECLLDAPVALYPLTEPDGSLSAGNIAATSQASLAVAQSKYGGGDVAFGAGTGLPTDGVASLMLNSTLTTGSGDDLKGYYLSGAAPTLPAGYGTAEAWFVVSSTMLAALNRHTGVSASPLAVPLFAFTSGSTVVGGLGLVSLDTTTIRVCWMTVDSDGNVTYFYNGNINVNDGGLHYAAASLAPSGNTSVVVVDGNSSTTMTLGISALTSGMSTVVGATGGTYYGSSTPLFRGTVAYAALYPTALSAARMTAHYTAGKTGFAGESTGTHVSRLLAYRPNTGSSVGTTSGTVGLHATTGETLQQALLDTAKAEGGIVYANGLGQITVRGRSANYNPSSVVTLDVSKDQVQADLSFRIDTQQLENDVTVSRVNGATQRVLDATSQATYGVRAVSDTLIVNTDVDALAAASWRLNSRKTAVVRSPSVSVDLLTETSTTFAQAVLAVKPLDVVTVSNMVATSAPASSVQEQVQGWSEQIGVDVWTVSFFTTPLPVAVMSWDGDAAHGWDAAAWAW